MKTFKTPSSFTLPKVSQDASGLAFVSGEAFLFKICNKCNLPKSIEDDFYKTKRKASAVERIESVCKECAKKQSHEYKLANKEKIKSERKYSKGQRKLESKRYYDKNKVRLREEKKQYRIDNKDVIDKWNEDNRDIKKVKRDGKREHNNATAKKRLDNNPLAKLAVNLRSRSRSAFKRKGWKKGATTDILLGADYETVSAHIESQFEAWMTWDNYPEWEIDHIIALSTAKTPEEMIKLCHYLNLCPLLAFDNRSKGPKLNWIKKCDTVELVS